MDISGPKNSNISIDRHSTGVDRTAARSKEERHVVPIPKANEDQVMSDRTQQQTPDTPLERILSENRISPFDTTFANEK